METGQSGAQACAEDHATKHPVSVRRKPNGAANNKDERSKHMKRIIKIAAVCLTVVLLSATIQSCSSEEDNGYSKAYANAVVTIKPNADNSQMYLQLDSNTLALPTNRKASPYGTKEVRALANLSEVEGTATKPANKLVFVNWLDTILTKPVAKNNGTDGNLKTYGSDPVEIVKSFETVAEDGYMTLRLRTVWGGQKAHAINLVHRTDANTPYLFTLYHNANGETAGKVGDALVAFRLPDAVDSVSGAINITVQWKSFTKNDQGDSTKTAVFKYVPRKISTDQRMK